MAEPEEKVDSRAEGKRIVRAYFSGILWARELRRTAVERTMRMTERDPYLRRADEWQERTEEEFGRAVDRWRRDPSKTASEVLKVIIEELDKRTDLTLLGRRVVDHCKTELERRKRQGL